MKTRQIELDVDVIGGQGSLTVEEEKAVRDFFTKRKLDSKRSTDNKRPRAVKPSKASV